MGNGQSAPTAAPAPVSPSGQLTPTPQGQKKSYPSLYQYSVQGGKRRTKRNKGRGKTMGGGIMFSPRVGPVGGKRRANKRNRGRGKTMRGGEKTGSGFYYS